MNDKVKHTDETRQSILPGISIDVVIFTIIDKKLAVLTIKRSIEPFKGQWTLVGGYVDTHQDSDLMATARRKLYEKTGIKTPYLVQSQTRGNAIRDPRGWSVTIVYYALIPANTVQLSAGVNASDITWTFVHDIPNKMSLAFDHNDILTGSLVQLRSKILSSIVPVHLMPDLFTLRELQDVYELILNKKIDAKSFRRRILASEILQPTEKKRTDNHRPALLYQRKKHIIEYNFLRHLESAIPGQDS